MPHIYVSKMGQHCFRINSDNGLLPVWRQAITWTNTELCSIGPLGTNFSEIWIKLQNCSFIKMHPKMLSAKWQPFCLGGDELIELYIIIFHGQATSPNILAGNPDDESGTWCVHPELLLCLPGQYTAGTGEWLKWFRRRNKMASNFCKYITNKNQ